MLPVRTATYREPSYQPDDADDYENHENNLLERVRDGEQGNQPIDEAENQYRD
jgi:hypothetical protein